MKPMKGAHLVLNDDILGFLQDALVEVSHAYGDDLADDAPHEVIDALEKNGWTKEQDSFGTKVYTARVYPVNGHEQGELRVTVVLTKQDMLMLDIRVWGDY